MALKQQAVDHELLVVQLHKQVADLEEAQRGSQQQVRQPGVLHPDTWSGWQLGRSACSWVVVV